MIEEYSLSDEERITLESDAIDMTQDLIRIDSSNWGDSSETVGEAEVADYCAERLREVGYSPEVITTTSDRRRGVALRIPGVDRTADALVVHGHLDVVPAVAQDWSHPPFSGEIDEGFIWGRGAVDMKNMDAMIMSVIRHWARSEVKPRRDTIVVFFPDEEAGMRHGSQWFVQNRPDIFEGATEAIGEVGGFSVSVSDDLRLYPIQTAEKGIRWLRLRAAARAGHGSMIHSDNAVTELARAVTRIGDHSWPIRRTKTVDQFLDSLADAFGVEIDIHDQKDLVSKLGTLGLLVGATLQNTANPSMLEAGYKVNVIPSEAVAYVDGRVLPGFEEEFDTTIRDLVGDLIQIDYISRDIALESAYDTLTVDLMAQVLRAEDPAAVAVPYMISGGTDAKALSTLGINCYGFSPLRMPANLDYWRLFHGVDERVPVEGLKFGVRTLERFMRAV
jgi:acetylornithine deacetylase/succinyl-diaminopimelate desuccinylase-like protein